MAMVMEITPLRELFNEPTVSCPRNILRSGGNFTHVPERTVDLGGFF
jgi:hypothetical protein